MTFFVEIILNKYWSGISLTWESKVLHTTTTEDSSPYILMRIGLKHLFLA